MRWFLIDRFVEIRKNEYAKAIKNVTLGEDHLHNYFPGFPTMPNSLIIESLAQTGGLLAGYTMNFQNAIFLAKIEKALFHELVLPGDQMILEANLLYLRENGCKVEGKASVSGVCVAEVSLLFASMPIDTNNTKSAVFFEQFISLLNLDTVARSPIHLEEGPL